MEYKSVASYKIGDGSSDFVKKIRAAPHSRFFASSSLANVPISLYTIQEGGISKSVNFLPPRSRQSNFKASKRRDAPRVVAEKSSLSFPKCGPSDFSCNFNFTESLPSFREGYKRSHDGISNSKENSQIMATCYRDGVVSLYDLRNNRPTAIIDDICSQNETHCIELVNFSSNGIQSSKFEENAGSRTSNTYFLVGDGSFVHLVDLRKLQVVDTMDYHSDIVTDIKFLPSVTDPAQCRPVITSSEDCALIMSNVNALGVDYCDSLSLSAPLRNICISQKGRVLVSTSIEEVTRASVICSSQSVDSLEMRLENRVKRFSDSSYIADMFCLSGMDFGESLSTPDGILDVTAFCVGDNAACDQMENQNLDIYYFAKKQDSFEKLATLVDSGNAVVRTVQPLILDGYTSLAYITGDESGAIRLWNTNSIES
ncbi:THO complex subunit 3 [Perkinsela sp. CCAP 1560/4]|nr:THO complex subunit 3 [Perkinsela sp. CCAP 1560/4]|eukprot:KNH04837.1 THO complex subunit 3 [Perkinsela sp. CCAP 1560/4]